MDRFENINTTGLITTALFKTTDVAEANMLRRSILSEIETYAIDVVSFDVNTSPRPDEIVALRLGQAVIDHSKYDDGDEFEATLDVTAPPDYETFNVTTDHIPDIPFTYVTPIVTLKPGQQLKCRVIVKLGVSRTHAKWRPVSTVTFSEEPDGFQIRFKSVGMLTPEQILEQGLARLRETTEQRPVTIFSRPILPENMDL